MFLKSIVWYTKSKVFLVLSHLFMESKTERLDAPLHAIGFEIEELSPHKVTGRLLVTHKCVQVSLSLSLFSSLISLSGI